jgi:hypothetical protein
MVARAGQVFDQAGEIVDPKIKGQLEQFLSEFVASLEPDR